MSNNLPGENDPIFQKNKLIMAYLNNEGIVLNVNPIGVKLSLFPKKELINKPFYKLKVIKKEDLPKYLFYFGLIISLKREISFYAPMYDRKQNKYYLHITLIPVGKKMRYILMVAKIIMRIIREKNKPYRIILTEDTYGRFQLPKRITEKFNLKNRYLQGIINKDEIYLEL